MFWKPWLISSVSFMIFLVTACSPETHKESEHRDLAKTGNLNQPVSSPILNDTSPPVLSLIETPPLDGSNIISFGFRSSEPGKIRYSGSCIGSTTNALKGDHHIKFVAMVEGTYDDCALQVTDASGNKSEPLQVPAFTVDFTKPELTAGMGVIPRVVGRTAAMSPTPVNRERSPMTAIAVDPHSKSLRGRTRSSSAFRETDSSATVN